MPSLRCLSKIRKKHSNQKLSLPGFQSTTATAQCQRTTSRVPVHHYKTLKRSVAVLKLTSWGTAYLCKHMFMFCCVLFVLVGKLWNRSRDVSAQQRPRGVSGLVGPCEWDVGRVCSKTRWGCADLILASVSVLVINKIPDGVSVPMGTNFCFKVLTSPPRTIAFIVRWFRSTFKYGWVLNFSSAVLVWDMTRHYCVCGYILNLFCHTTWENNQKNPHPFLPTHIKEIIKKNLILEPSIHPFWHAFCSVWGSIWF